MSQQELLFPDPEEGRRRRDEAIDRVEENAGVPWNVTARLTLLEILERLRRFQKFTSEEVRRVMSGGRGRPRTILEPWAASCGGRSRGS